MTSTLRIAVSQEQGNAPVTVLHLKGEIDANTQADLESKAEEVIGTGTQNLLLDLSEVTYMGSAGFRAMHAIAGKLGNEQSATAIKSSHLKLLSPSAEVSKVIKTLGFDSYLDIYEDINQAVNSF
jgi:anti-anti-sigma factor